MRPLKSRLLCKMWVNLHHTLYESVPYRYVSFLRNVSTRASQLYNTETCKQWLQANKIFISLLTEYKQYLTTFNWLRRTKIIRGQTDYVVYLCLLSKSIPMKLSFI
jgi:hypothetical protein